MLTLTLNPGLILMAGAFLVLAMPFAARAPVMVLAAIAAMWALMEPEFGGTASIAQIGLRFVPFHLDALNQVFGLAFVACAIVLGVYSGARRARVENAAILLLAGAATTVLFVGDLASVIAFGAIAGLASAWVALVARQPGAGAAGVRLLVWNGLEGLLLLVGFALYLASEVDGASLGRLRADDLAGSFIFAGLLIRVGAPLAHVWVKDVIAHAGAAGGAALSAYSAALGVYALARYFPTEPLLMPVGAVMAVIGLIFALAEDDLRRSAAAALTAQLGICLSLIGVGTPLAMSGAIAHAFASIMAFAFMQMVLGAMVEARGNARRSGLAGLARSMPITAAQLFVAGLATAGAPGFATYASMSVATEALAQWEFRALWLVAVSAAPILMIALVLRPMLATAGGALAPATPLAEAPFARLLASGIAGFICLAVGCAPSWLFALTPTPLDFAPFAPDRLAAYMEVVGLAGACFVLVNMFGLAPPERAVRVLDMDAIYRGPLADAALWTARTLVRTYAAWHAFVERAALATGAAWRKALSHLDQPHRDFATAPATLFPIAAALLLALFAFQRGG